MSGFLTSHSRINIPAVGSNMWTYFYGRYGDLARDQDFERCLDALVHYKHVRFLEPDVDRVRREFRQGPATYARLFALLLEHHAERAGKARWGAQTGLIERYGDELIAAHPGVQVVHMIRDPRDRYAESLAKWPDGKGRAGGAVARWHYSRRLAERLSRAHPDQYLIVRFEDLVTDTEATLRHVCDFLGESFEPAMLRMDGMPTQRDRLGGGDADIALSTDHVGHFASIVPVAEIEFIDSAAGRAMARYGYPTTDHRPWSARARSAAATWPANAARMAAWQTVETLQQRLPTVVARRPGSRMILKDA